MTFREKARGFEPKTFHTASSHRINVRVEEVRERDGRVQNGSLRATEHRLDVVLVEENVPEHHLADLVGPLAVVAILPPDRDLARPGL